MNIDEIGATKLKLALQPPQCRSDMSLECESQDDLNTTAGRYALGKFERWCSFCRGFHRFPHVTLVCPDQMGNHKGFCIPSYCMGVPELKLKIVQAHCQSCFPKKQPCLGDGFGHTALRCVIPCHPHSGSPRPEVGMTVSGNQWIPSVTSLI